jgi:hypothetical protein
LDVRGLDLAYPDIAEIRRVEFVILHTRWDPDGAGGRGAWFRLADPTYYEVTQFSRANRGLIATIPGGITGEAPAAASIRITYLDQSGDTHVVDLERNYTQVASRHRLFFVPRYHVFGAEVDVVVGFDAFPRTIDGVVLAPFATNPGNWEEHCRIRSKGFSESGFPGELEFIGPQAEPRRPTQGYRIQMPAFQSGRFTVSYQVVCPDGVDPTGRDLFMRWGFLGEYPSTTVLVRGMPPIESVRTRP